MPVHHRLALLQAGLDRTVDPPAKGFATTGAPTWYAPDLPLQPVHLDIRATLDLDARSLDGAVAITLRATRDGARRVVLDGVDLLNVAVDGGAAGAVLSWRYDGQKLTVVLDAPLSRGQECTFTVRYRVHDPLTGLHFGGPTAVTPAAGRWAGTDHETERARYWLPCVDHPAVRPTVDLRLRAAEGMRILGPGALVADDAHDDGTHTAHWHLDFPCPSYLLCFLVGELVEADGGEHQGKPIRFFAPTPAVADDLRCSFAPTADMLSWITTRLGRPLPWPKYFQFAAPGIGGAMENISLVSWDDAWLVDDATRAELGWLVDLINLHEMSHTWFGDAVVCRDFAHSWLKESWATYMESVWLEEHQGVDAMQAMLFEELRAYLSEARDRYKRPIATRRFDSSWDLFDRHLYPGGAVRLHHLRCVVGDEPFWAAVTDYLEQFTGKVVETDDFRRVMEDHSGRSLARFFDQWFRSPGYPCLKVSGEHDADRGVYTVRVEQTQVDDAAGVGLFDLPLSLAVQDADGAWHRLRMDLSERSGAVTLPLPAPPRQLVVDPDSELPHDLDGFDPGDDCLVRSLTDCPSVRGRLRAAEAACRLGRRAPLDALARAFRTEPVWMVRRLMAAFLGDAKVPQAAAIIAQLLSTESDPRVLGPLALAAGKHRDPGLADTLASFVQRPDAPVLASMHALSSLGAQRGDAHLHLLASFLDRDSRWDRLRKGALAGLGATRSTDALSIIRPFLAPDRAVDHTRAIAVSAFADAAAWAPQGLRRQVADELVDLLRDDAYKVRLAAARGLGSLGATDRSADIDALAPRVAGQDLAALRRVVEGLRKQDPGKADKRIEELTDALRKLTARVDSLEADR